MGDNKYMEEVRWGIIGCGDVCEKKSGPAFYKIPHSRLVAVMRRDEEKARDFALRHDVPEYYTDADALIHDPQVNAIYIATPPDTHKEYAIRAMQAGKPVYVEKPMALTYQECLDMIKVSEETGQKLFVAFYRRGMDYFQKVKELVDCGAIGSVLTVRIHFSRPPLDTDKDPARHTWRVKKEIAGGGYFYDMASHTLDIVDYIAGAIEEVSSFTTNLVNLYEVEDTLAACFRFASGALGTGLWCYVSPVGNDTDVVEIMGTKGTVSFNTFAFEPIRLITEEGEQVFPISPPEHVEMPLVRTIVEELRGEGCCPSTALTALRTALVMDRITQVNI